MNDKQPMCGCGRGRVSGYDGKCGHCRTKAEKRAHLFRLREGLYGAADDSALTPKSA